MDFYSFFCVRGDLLLTFVICLEFVYRLFTISVHDFHNVCFLDTMSSLGRIFSIQCSRFIY